jgi:hypothetical protein
MYVYQSRNEDSGDIRGKETLDHFMSRQWFINRKYLNGIGYFDLCGG